MQSRLKQLLLAFSLFVVSLTCWAVEPVYNDSGLAISGYDPVAYFTEQRPVWGNSKFTHQWQNVTWQFDSETNKKLFIANPEKYAPQYGGYCAYAAAKGSVVPSDPKSWSINNGKLYLNYSPAIQQRWSNNINGYTTRADKKWPTLIK